MPLEDYKDIVGTAASVVTICQFFSGVFICLDIVKRRSTKDVSVMPFLGGTTMGFLMLIYANILNDPAMIPVNWFGIGLNAAYFLCYFIYSHEKGNIVKQTLYASIFVGIIYSYVLLESPENVEHRYGILITVLFFLLIGSPLFSLGEIIEKKSSASLPLPLILSGTVVSCLWLLYGIIIKNGFIQFQNIIGFGLSVIQLSLCIIYPRTPSDVVDKEKKKD